MVTTIAPTTYSPQPASTSAAGRCPQELTAHAPRPTQASDVPKSAVMNTGVTASLLIEFIARMLCPGASRSRAGMTKDEKAKKTPAERPQPRAVERVRYWTRRLMPRSETRASETVHGQIARVHAPASTSRLRGDFDVLGPPG